MNPDLNKYTDEELAKELSRREEARKLDRDLVVRVKIRIFDPDPSSDGVCPFCNIECPFLRRSGSELGPHCLLFGGDLGGDENRPGGPIRHPHCVRVESETKKMVHPEADKGIDFYRVFLIENINEDLERRFPKREHQARTSIR